MDYQQIALIALVAFAGYKLYQDGKLKLPFNLPSSDDGHDRGKLFEAVLEIRDHCEALGDEPACKAIDEKIIPAIAKECPE